MLQVALVFGFWVDYGVNRNILSEGNIPVAVHFDLVGMLLICQSFMPES